MRETKVTANNISLQYGVDTILKDISFELTGDKIYGLLGRNGAGKTTLLSLLAAYDQPTSGTLNVNNQIVFEHTDSMESIIFVKEESFEYEYENVKKWLSDRALFRPHYDADYANYLIKRFKLPLDQSVNHLSRGMQSALLVVNGLASRCPITIFDEAYLGMDAPAREIFYEEVLNDYMEHPRLIILSTHLISEMDNLFEEVLIIKEGSLLVHDRTDNLLESGVKITGQSSKVDSFVSGATLLNEQTLGDTKSVMLYGKLDETQRQKAKELDLQVGTVKLQELFIHLTEEGSEQV
ncbi:ATP-binding cassette domain-containing protein [Alkalicoccobacillus porphyridii]|uniref:ABC transporter ATP-binding protein n=1 Tax=Alkalicoccobacillus porphyridii TaxID=2597270 RepID=A0A553ZTW8_9BACI|nr:ABC transporter ATP-binding protein [Alkalicoccobacillus porphyridii]TSB44912.1 ABC transporter ATP-binding protein [Alkalicoccobacillus porphyridii]